MHPQMLRLTKQIPFSVIISVFLLFVLTQAAPAEDEIKSLPGLTTLTSELNFKQYSGYLKASEGKYLFYWFVTSERSPQNDPLLLWLNGGPGCSSLGGYLGEHGPFHVNKDGKTLYPNPYSWNKIANVLYLEAPAGVGFSYSKSRNYAINDDEVAEDNYLALKSFFDKYPEYIKNDFYLTGESYAGIYVPTLSLKVLTGPQLINMKGFAIGNGLSDRTLNGDSLIFFGYYHGLFGEQILNDLVQNCCKGTLSRQNCAFANPSSSQCEHAVNDAKALILNDNLNVYNLYSDCYQTSTSSVRSTKSKKNRRTFDFNLISSCFQVKKSALNLLHAFKNVFKTRKSPPLVQYFNSFLPRNIFSEKSSRTHIVTPCIDDSFVENWLNQPSVRKALHVASEAQDWEECSSTVGSTYQSTYETVKPIYEKLLGSGKIRALVYNGDVDMACNFLGDQWFVESLNLPVLSRYQEWYIGRQVAGFYKKFQNLSLVTIKGSGHMVPQDKPEQAYKMIEEYLNGNF